MPILNFFAFEDQMNPLRDVGSFEALTALALDLTSTSVTWSVTDGSLFSFATPETIAAYGLTISNSGAKTITVSATSSENLFAWLALSALDDISFLPSSSLQSIFTMQGNGPSGESTGFASGTIEVSEVSSDPVLVDLGGSATAGVNYVTHYHPKGNAVNVFDAGISLSSADTTNSSLDSVTVTLRPTGIGSVNTTERLTSSAGAFVSNIVVVGNVKILQNGLGSVLTLA